jgi:MFS family permease
VTVDATSAVPEASGDQLLAILLAMAMFVLVFDASLMNVSISAVLHDLDTTASGVQSAIALEALVSAAFILIGSKIGDLFGRKRAYILGLLGYAAGALSMTLAEPAADRHLLGGAVGALLAVGIVGLGSLAWWLGRRKREGKPALIDAGLFKSKYFRLGISSQTLQQIALGGLMIALPIYLQMVLETTRWRRASHSRRSRSACSPSRSWRVSGRGSAARAGSS